MKTLTGKAQSQNNSENKKLRFGVLGVARINAKVLPAIHHSPFASLQAIASRNLAKAEIAKTNSSFKKAYGSYEALLEDPEIDAIYIPLPNALHVEWVEKAAIAKKHILCEKPLGLTEAEVKRAIEICKKNEVALMDGFMWAHHPRTLAIQELLTSNAIGKIQHVQSIFTFELQRPQDDIRRTKKMGGGALYDIGCYCVRGVLFAFRELPIAVTANAKWSNEIDVEMDALLEFKNGTSASIRFSFLSPYQSHFQISGEEKTIQVPRPWNPDEKASFEVWNKTGLEFKKEFEKTNHIDRMIDNFAKYCLGISSFLPDIHIALELAKVIDALYLSAREQRKVYL